MSPIAYPAPASDIISNSRKMRGLVIACKVQARNCVILTKVKLYIIQLELKIAFEKYLKTSHKRIANSFIKFDQIIR